MEKNRFYVDIHVLQTVPPSCVNRDDTGSPKTAVYGGVTRARVSSQSWKRAVRQMFGEMFDKDDVGVRTKRLIDMVSREIMEQGADTKTENAEKMAEEALKNAGVKFDKNKMADALFFMSKAQASALAALAVQGDKDKENYKKAIKDNPSADIALFGRMVAADPSLNYDAAAQVAHSISTHAVQTEYDYFTAVDDLSPDDSSGAGHLGTVEYDAATLYRYATVNLAELEKHLGDKMPEVAEGFVKAFICSMPTGKQNPFANRTLPDAVYVTVRNDQPVNMSGAFERPVKSNGDGYVSISKKRFCEYASMLYSTFTEPPAHSFAIGEGMESLAQCGSLSDMIKWLDELIGNTQKGGERS